MIYYVSRLRLVSGCARDLLSLAGKLKTSTASRLFRLSLFPMIG